MGSSSEGASLGRREKEGSWSVYILLTPSMLTCAYALDDYCRDNFLHGGWLDLPRDLKEKNERYMFVVPIVFPLIWGI